MLLQSSMMNTAAVQATSKTTEAKIHPKYLNDSQVAVFGVGAQIKDVPLHIHCGWKEENQSQSYKLKPRRKKKSLSYKQLVPKTGETKPPVVKTRKLMYFYLFIILMTDEKAQSNNSATRSQQTHTHGIYIHFPCCNK